MMTLTDNFRKVEATINAPAGGGQMPAAASHANPALAAFLAGPRIQKACGMCGRTKVELPDGVELKRCGSCMKIAYCSTECQRAAWSLHKEECNRFKKLVESNRSTEYKDIARQPCSLRTGYVGVRVKFHQTGHLVMVATSLRIADKNTTMGLGPRFDPQLANGNVTGTGISVRIVLQRPAYGYQEFPNEPHGRPCLTQEWWERVMPQGVRSLSWSHFVESRVRDMDLTLALMAGLVPIDGPDYSSVERLLLTNLPPKYARAAVASAAGPCATPTSTGHLDAYFYEHGLLSCMKSGSMVARIKNGTMIAVTGDPSAQMDRPVNCLQRPRPQASMTEKKPDSVPVQIVQPNGNPIPVFGQLYLTEDWWMEMMPSSDDVPEALTWNEFKQSGTNRVNVAAAMFSGLIEVPFDSYPHLEQLFAKHDLEVDH